MGDKEDPGAYAHLERIGRGREKWEKQSETVKYQERSKESEKLELQDFSKRKPAKLIPTETQTRIDTTEDTGQRTEMATEKQEKSGDNEKICGEEETITKRQRVVEIKRGEFTFKFRRIETENNESERKENVAIF